MRPYGVGLMDIKVASVGGLVGFLVGGVDDDDSFSKHGREEDEREKWDGIVLCSCLHRFGCWLSWLAPFAHSSLPFAFSPKPPYSPTYLCTSIVGITAGWEVSVLENGYALAASVFGILGHGEKTLIAL